MVQGCSCSDLFPAPAPDLQLQHYWADFDTHGIVPWVGRTFKKLIRRSAVGTTRATGYGLAARPQ